MYTELVSSSVGSIGMLALASFISSPSGSETSMAYVMRDSGVGGLTQTEDEEEENSFGNSYQTIWLKKPYLKYSALPKIK